jgi:hypothetical protein
MTAAEILHVRKMRLKMEVVKPLLTLMDRGLDVPGILQNLIRDAQAGKNLENLKQGQDRDSKE